MAAPPNSSLGSSLMRLLKHRRFGRLLQQRLMSNLGPVIDISAGGMAVRANRVPKDVAMVEIIGHPLPSPLQARVVWSRRAGIFKHDVGLEFLDVTSEMARALCAIAGANSTRAAA